MATAAAPDYAEPLIAWRTWSLARSGRAMLLRSVVKPTTWLPGSAVRARCLRPRVLRWRRGHAAPAIGCSCGVYAADLAVAASYLDAARIRLGTVEVQQVLGRVALWGDVVVCEQGYRATYAYPEHLYVAGRDGLGAERRDAWAVASALEPYGVPVTLVDAAETRLRDVLALTAGGV